MAMRRSAPDRVTVVAHRGYIGVEQYERNLAKMAANRATAEAAEAPRSGPGLLAGLVICAFCGNRLQIGYETSRRGTIHCYICNRRRAT